MVATADTHETIALRISSGGLIDRVPLGEREVALTNRAQSRGEDEAAYLQAAERRTIAPYATTPRNRPARLTATSTRRPRRRSVPCGDEGEDTRVVAGAARRVLMTIPLNGQNGERLAGCPYSALVDSWTSVVGSAAGSEVAHAVE